MIRRQFVAAIALAMSTPAVAQSIDFAAISTSGVSAARADIDSMPKDELRSLLNYFAECTDRSTRPSPSCTASYNRYCIEYGTGRPIDKTLSALEQAFETRRTIRQLVPDTKGSPRAGIEDVDQELRDAIGGALRSRR